MSLRWKIALAMAAIVAVAAIVLGAATYRSTSSRLLDEVDRSLAQLDPLVVNARHLDQSLLQRGPLAVYEVQLLALDGSIVASTLADTSAEAAPVSDRVFDRLGTSRWSLAETVETDAGRYRVRTIGLPRGAVQTMRSLDESERVLAALRNRIVLLVLAVSSVAVLAGWLIASRVTASLRRLTTAAEHVESTGSLDVRVHEVGDDEVARLSDAFDRMITALAGSRAQQHRLVQDAGHELRTPLTSLRTNLDVLRRHPGLPPDQRAAVVADLHAEVAELTDLVDEIVAVAGGDLADEPLSSFDLADVAREVADRFGRRTGRELVVVAPPTPVTARRSAVHRAVSCLVDNATKFDTSGGPIELAVGDGAVTVRDHGPGIPIDELPLVFERFHRADDARTLPGSGLGLSIVRDVAERHGGAATARNAPGGGAIVGFSLGGVVARVDDGVDAGL
jgi:two-component system sensor histidine kinase MprB